MDNKQLQALVMEISEQFFAKPFLHNATFNNRLRTTGGRYMLQSHNIEINPKQYEIHGYEALIGIIKHELCHYHLHLEKRGYQHRDKDFQELLAKVGGSRYCKDIPGTRRKESIKYKYCCQACGQLFLRKRRIDLSRYACGKCRGKLISLKMNKTN